MHTWQLFQKSPHGYFFLTLLGCQGTGMAAETLLSDADYFPTDIPIVLSATRLKQTAADTPVATSVIDRQMIEASGFTEIPDLLRLVPGFVVDYDSGSVQVAGYHLLPDVYVRQQQVLIDGRSVYNPPFGGVPWTDLPITIDDIDRIEVVRGPNAATYGSNSFLGVINIITRHAVLDKGSAVKTNIGTHQQREVFLRHGGSDGDLDYRVTAAYRSDNGFDNRYDSKLVRLVNSRFDYQVNPHNDLSFQAGYNEGPRQKDDALYHDTLDYSRQEFSQFQQVRWENRLSTDDEFHVQFYHNFIQDNNKYHDQSINLTRDETISGDRYDIEAQYNKGASPDRVGHFHRIY